MPNHTIVAGSKAVKLGGATLRADFNALCAIEEATGKAVTDLFAGAGAASLSMRDFRAVTLALGRFESPEASGDWIDRVGIGAAGDAVGEAVTLGFGDGLDKEEEPGEA